MAAIGAEPPNAGPRQSRRFLALYALAAAGGAVAYVPFLTILLPVQVQALAPENGIAALAYITFVGAITASLANIAFGWVSDRTARRRSWIAGGLLLSAALLVAMPGARSVAALMAMVAAWQIALNMMLAPLAAWAGDSVPDRQKGTLGGLLAFSPALGAASGMFVTWPGLATAETRLVLVAVLTVLMVGPVLVLGAPRPMPQLMSPCEGPPTQRPRESRTVAAMWLARLLVQIAEAALFAFLLFWLQSIDASFGDNDIATVFAAVLCLSVPIAMLAGRWSDRRNRPLRPLVVSAAVGSTGLLVMAFATGLGAGIAGYVVFGLGMSVFLTLHASQTLRVLPRPATRGRDLGIFNLTNTVPSLIVPWLTLALVPLFGFGALFLLLAALAMIAVFLLLAIDRI